MDNIIQVPGKYLGLSAIINTTGPMRACSDGLQVWELVTRRKRLSPYWPPMLLLNDVVADDGAVAAGDVCCCYC